MRSISRARQEIERLRLRLAGQRGAFILAALGLATGVIAGAVTIIFRAVIEGGAALAAPLGFESLETDWRFMLPIIGTALAVLLLMFFGRGKLRTGVVHVLERLSYNEGQLPFKNAALQFSAGSLLLSFGLSLGREGPGIHLGAASGSLLGQWVRIPHNSLRTLVGCGVAAAIAASFNTPLAGVVFAMEVILMEYTIDGFVPVILAGVSGAALGRLVYGTAPAFLSMPFSLVSLWELPYIVAMGVLIGALAAGFILLVRALTRLNRAWPWWLRMLTAGVLVGGCAALVPQIMGVGYDIVNSTVVGHYAVGTLAAIALIKLVATGIGISAGLPGGLIGPTLVIGAAAGGVLGYIGTGVVPIQTSDVGLYAMLGMGAMMGATLQAPLAALLALLELTGNPNIILPGMLAIVSASLAAKELFRCESVYAIQMRELGLDHANDPVTQQLRRLGVPAVMSDRFHRSPPVVSPARAAELLVDTPQWIIIEREDAKVLLPAADLARHLETKPADDVKLLEIPGRRRSLAPIRVEATLQAGLDTLERCNAEALYVENPVESPEWPILGVVTRDQIEAAYRYRPAALPHGG
jgi:CIC family chloride channel protein